MSRTFYYLVSWIDNAGQSAGYSIHAKRDDIAGFVERFAIAEPPYVVTPDGVDGQLLADRISIRDRGHLSYVFDYINGTNVRLIPNLFPSPKHLIPKEFRVPCTQDQQYWISDDACEEVKEAKLASPFKQVLIPLGPNGTKARQTFFGRRAWVELRLAI